MSFDEYYRRLELPGTASPAEVKRAYRRLRAKYHPDRNKGRETTVEAAFKRVQEAFEILSGERKAPMPNPPANASSPVRREDPIAPREYRPRPPMRGANCVTELFVPLDVAIHGGEVQASYSVKGACPQCHVGASSRCPTCLGTGFAVLRKGEAVEILPGAWDGQRLVVEGAGHPGGHGGAPGDAIFSIVIVCSSAYRRDGLNIACDIQVDCVTALLGGSFEAQVLGRAVQLTIAPNTQSGSAIRLRRQGLIDRNGARGDLTLHVILSMPASVSYLTDDDRGQLRAIFDAARRRAMRATPADVSDPS